MTEENQVKHLTKQNKHPGRVAWGKELARRNRENKAKLQKKISSSQEVESSTSQEVEPSTSQEVKSSTSSSIKSSHVLMIIGVLAVAGVGAYYMQRKNQTKNDVTESQKKDAIFNPF